MQQNNGFLAVAILVSGIVIALALFMAGGEKKGAPYEFASQAGSVVVRFDRFSGEVCFLLPVPDPQTNNISFLADSWSCMAGNKTKPGKIINIEELKQGGPTAKAPENQKANTAAKKK